MYEWIGCDVTVSYVATTIRIFVIHVGVYSVPPSTVYPHSRWCVVFCVRVAIMAHGISIYTCTCPTDGVYIRLLRANVHLRGGITQLALVL